MNRNVLRQSSIRFVESPFKFEYQHQACPFYTGDPCPIHKRALNALGSERCAETG
jgi:hypothetical protein